MAIELSTPDAYQLGDVVRALRDWQRDDSPMQLHPGDLGWNWQFGAETTAAAVRAWSREDSFSPSDSSTVPSYCG